MFRRTSVKRVTARKPASRVSAFTRRIRAARAAALTSPRSAPLATRGFAFPFKVGEKKFADLSSQTWDINTTGSITLLAAPTPGTDYTNRIGRKIVLKSVYIRGLLRSDISVNLGTSTSAPGQLARLILLIDTQPNGTAPAMTDILVTATSTSMLNPNNRDRFKVLWDKQVAIGPMGFTATANSGFSCPPQSFAIKKFMPLKMEMIFNSGSAGTIADVVSGALYLVSIGNVAASVSADCSAILSTRVRFADP